MVKKARTYKVMGGWFLFKTSANNWAAMYRRRPDVVRVTVRRVGKGWRVWVEGKGPYWRGLVDHKWRGKRHLID